FIFMRYLLANIERALKPNLCPLAVLQASIIFGGLCFIGHRCAGQPSLSVANVPGFPGTTISVPVSVRKAGSAVAAQFDVAYNNSKVAANDAESAGRLSNHVVRSREISPGMRRVL